MLSWASAVLASEHRRDVVGPSEAAHAGPDESSFGLFHLEDEMSREFEARVADEWESERDMYRETCLTLKLQVETHSLAPAVDGAHRKNWR